MNRHPTALPAGLRRYTVPTRPPGPAVRERLGVVLGLLAMLGLLLLFGRVVSGAVRQGEQQRQAAALHADGVWRCNGMPSRGLRDRCVNGLATPGPGAGPQLLAEGLQDASFNH